MLYHLKTLQISWDYPFNEMYYNILPEKAIWTTLETLPNSLNRIYRIKEAIVTSLYTLALYYQSNQSFVGIFYNIYSSYVLLNYF